ncbi:src-like-adapter isoform X1 [Labeo rohita]|uniref:Src-like-adapter isoform X1 n=1 Tax=Labeo rohita TaxID=84645 RepID=A0A498NIG3_LABRO|nr:src-like-adapter isoform X1 [Labeo rohita]
MGGTLASQRTLEEFRQPHPTEDPPPRVDENDTAVVLDNYPPPDICEPIFRMGDWLKILSDWLFETVTRPKAEELLRLPGNRVGSFLIRESAKGSYTLSVRHRNIKHYRIVRMPNNWYFISPRLTFQCLEDLVNHYSDIADGLCCVLTGPCLTTCETTLSQLTKTPGKKLSFDWRAVNSSELVQQSTSPSAVSYGVQNSVSSYLSLLGQQEKPEKKKFSLKKRWRSVYVTQNNQLDSLATVEDNYEEVN